MFHAEMSDMEVQEYFDNFFEEVFTELEDRVISVLLWMCISVLCCIHINNLWPATNYLLFNFIILAHCSLSRC